MLRVACCVLLLRVLCSRADALSRRTQPFEVLSSGKPVLCEAAGAVMLTSNALAIFIMEGDFSIIVPEVLTDKTLSYWLQTDTSDPLTVSYYRGQANMFSNKGTVRFNR